MTDDEDVCIYIYIYRIYGAKALSEASERAYMYIHQIQVVSHFTYTRIGPLQP